MNHEIAYGVLHAEMKALRVQPYQNLEEMVGKNMYKEVISGEDGKPYQVEIDVMWDDERGGNLRVLGSVDDGGWRTFIPLTDDFIMGPNGEFVGE
ncbi:MAG TPA: hypothetical protein VNK82_02700 [Terriglobales bacterium]|nr:hypothetical protein [Terriglobales bacterium]